MTRVQRAYGVTVANGFPATLEQDYARYEYTPNGKQKAVIDANGNRAEMTFDGHDRQQRWIFPSNTPGLANQGDYEEYGYDLVGNRTSLRKRDGTTIGYSHDLNRVAVKSVPASVGGAPGYSVFYGYDVRGLQTYARFGSASGTGISNAYDGFGRLTSSTTNMDGVARTFNSQYDAASNRIVLSSPSNYYASFAYDALGRMSAYKEGATTVVQFNYDTSGRRSGLAFFGGTSTASYGYDPVGRLNSLGRDLAGGGADQSVGFAYNPASQIVTRPMSNDAYASNTAYNVSRAYSVNGLNQYTAAGPASFAYDANGNLTSDGSTSFVYDAENRLVSASGARNASLVYDPLGRLWQTSGAAAGITRFIYDGDRLVEEYDGYGNRPRVYVHGPGADEPLVLYELTGGPVHRFYHADHQGSIVALADDYGNALAINGYDPWGIPNPGNAGRFQYTGQAWIAELGMYYYKARIYSPTLGRFLQTDPIGYDDEINLYTYVGNDPANGTDPTGLAVEPGCGSRLGNSASCSGETLLGLIEAASTRRPHGPREIGPGGHAGPKPPGGSVPTEVPPEIPGGPYTEKPAVSGNRAGSFQGPPQAKGPRAQAQWVPPEGQGGIRGSRGYWKVQYPGQKGWQRYSNSGKALTQSQAHPSPQQESAWDFVKKLPMRVLGAVACILLCEAPAN